MCIEIPVEDKHTASTYLHHGDFGSKRGKGVGAKFLEPAQAREIVGADQNCPMHAFRQRMNNSGRVVFLKSGVTRDLVVARVSRSVLHKPARLCGVVNQVLPNLLE